MTNNNGILTVHTLYKLVEEDHSFKNQPIMVADGFDANGKPLFREDLLEALHYILGTVITA